MLLPKGITDKQRQHARDLIVRGHAERKVKRARALESLKRELGGHPEKLQQATERLVREQGLDDAGLEKSLKKVNATC